MENHKANLTAIAEAIREKEGSTQPIVASEFPERIRGISTGLTQEEGDGRYIMKDPTPQQMQQMKGGITMSGSGASLCVEGTDNRGEYMFGINSAGFEALYNPSAPENGSQMFYISGVFEVQTDRETGEEYARCYIADYSGGHSFVISGVGSPHFGDDVANKDYVDDTVKAALGDIGAVLDAINGEVA